MYTVQASVKMKAFLLLRAVEAISYGIRYTTLLRLTKYNYIKEGLTAW